VKELEATEDGPMDIVMDRGAAVERGAAKDEIRFVMGEKNSKFAINE